ncbi:MAG: DMT family transporter [Bacteroidales bacterium]|nr:DMT family transporter [Bacteroidales bacterium]
MKKNNILTYILLVLTAVFWGGSFVLTKEIFLSAPSITPSIIVTLRLVVASIVFVPFLLIAKKWQKIERRDIKYFFLLAFLEPFTYFLCENNGIKLVPGGISSIIIATIPVFVPFGLYFAYHEKLYKINVIGVLLSLIGIVVMISGDGMTTDISMKGILLLFGAVVIAVLYTIVLMKVVKHYHPFTITVHLNLIGLVYFVPTLLIFDFQNFMDVTFTTRIFGMIACLGIVCSTLSYVFFNYGIVKVGASRASVFNNSIPVFTLIFAAMLGQESITITKVLGMAVAISGVVIAQIKPKGKE